MAIRSKPLKLWDAEKFKNVNPVSLKYWDRYETDMGIRDLSPSTVYNYESDFKQWMIYVLDNQGNASVTELEEEDIEEFLFYCKKHGNNSARMKRRMSTISALYRYLRKKKIIKENPMEFIDRPTKDVAVVKQTYLTPDEVKLMREKLNALVESVTTVHMKDNAMTLRLYALFSLSTMARVNAVRNTLWKSIDYENRMVHDVLEKEGKIVDLMFSKEVSELLKELKEYRTEHDIEDGGYVFVGTKINGTWMPITSSTAGDWCKKIGEMIDEPTLHPHDFRHSGATLLKNAGMSLEDVSSLLNHAGTDVTNKYYIKKDGRKINTQTPILGVAFKIILRAIQHLIV